MSDSENRRRYWGVVGPTTTANELAQTAKQQEDLGLEGVFAPQVYGPPWIPLSAAATATEHLLLGSGIADAFVRSPFETAMAALDLDRISNGRFILGLGPTVRSWSEGIFGSPGYGKPLKHLRECVDVIRHIIKHSHTGGLTHYSGDFYNFDWSEFQGNPPPVRDQIPIWLPPVRGPLIELSAEIADGLMGHPIWSLDWIKSTVAKHIDAGLARGGRQRSDLHVCVWLWVTPNPDAAESIEDARAVTAFYGGIEQYHSYYAAHGFARQARQLQAGVQRGDYQGVAHLVPDEMASTFVVTGTPSQVREKVAAVWDVADSVCLVPPLLSLPPDKTAYYFNTIAETFYL